MRLHRLPRRAVAGVVLPATLLLAGCGSDLSSYLDNNRVQLSEASVRDVYGEQWKEFAVQCPGEGPEEIAARFGVPVDDVENLSDRDDYQYFYLRAEDGATDKQSVKVEDAVVCAPAAEAGIEFTEWLPADLKLKYEKATPQDDWVLDAEALKEDLEELQAEREAERERDRGDGRGRGERGETSPVPRPSASPS